VTVPPAARITTARLVLDPLSVDDAHEMATVLAAPALYTHTGGAPPTVAKLRDRYAAQVVGASADGAETWCNWIVREGEGGPATGYVQATITADGSVADVAWVIGEAWQGRGYASEAARGMVEWLGRQGVRTITAHIHPDHEASARVANALGLKPGLVMEEGELVWRAAIDPRLPGFADRRRRVARLNVLVGLALAAFGAFEIVMVRRGELPGGADQVIRDVVLVIVGIGMIAFALAARRRVHR
jgi:RimJ/RimL family protein N-acetyltransferase